MKKFLILAIAAALSSSLVFAAEEFATTKDAETIVAKAVKAVTADRATTLKEITAKDPKWVDRDLYAVVYDMNGLCCTNKSKLSLPQTPGGVMAFLPSPACPVG